MWLSDTSKCYYRIYEDLTQSEAIKGCEALDATLTSIRSQEENDLIDSLLCEPYCAGGWIGGRLTEEGVWRWVNLT